MDSFGPLCRLDARGRRAAACAPVIAGRTSTGATDAVRLDAAARARQVVNRFTFGARPGDFESVERMRSDAWIDRQLHPERIDDRVTDTALGLLDISHKTSFELNADHPQANEYGVIPGRGLDTATIRAHALGKFRDLLGAVATSPAMLFYLDNYQSRVDSLHPTRTEWLVEQRRRANPPLGDTMLIVTVKRRRTGVNENYARELMKLHTLGVDGGYTQKDVQEVARCLTGWSIEEFATGGKFVFDASAHDAGEKMVLGVRIAGGRGSRTASRCSTSRRGISRRHISSPGSSSSTS